MSIRHAMLGLLAEGPLHGYELKSAYEADLVPRSQLNFGQVYKTLERLSRDGLVSNHVVRQAERPDKKVYEITPAGREQLDRWLAEPSRLDLDLRNQTFLKLMLARRLAAGDPSKVIAGERRAALEKLHEVQHARAQRGTENALQTTLLLDLAALRLEAFLKWLDRCEATLRQENSK